MCVYMHSRFVENHPIRILEDGPLIFEVVLSQRVPPTRKQASCKTVPSTIAASKVFKFALSEAEVHARFRQRSSGMASSSDIDDVNKSIVCAEV
jgi:hypothetical protein